MNSDDVKNRDRADSEDSNWEDSNWDDDDDFELEQPSSPAPDALAPLPELKMPDSTVASAEGSTENKDDLLVDFWAEESTAEAKNPPEIPKDESPEEEPESPVIASEEPPEEEPESPVIASEEEPEEESESPVIASEEPPEDGPESPAIDSEELPEVEPESPAAASEGDDTISVSFESAESAAESPSAPEPPESKEPEVVPPRPVAAAEPPPEAIAQLETAIARLTQNHLAPLEARKRELQSEIEQLERRRDRIREEMRTSFAGVSQDMAIRVQGFKEYLVGSLQDLAAAAEQLELPKLEARPEPRESSRRRSRRQPDTAPAPRLGKSSFKEQRQQINALLDQYRTRPDYYGPPWQLRRTFEPIHADRVKKWLISQGGRGAVRTMGSRLQNILIASAAMSVLRNLYGDRLRVLVLSNTPERLGEWRRGLQDCLGISRSDFGPTRGVVLFESPQALVQKAERFTEEKQLPAIVIDEAEGQLDLSLLQFPLLLAFAPDPNSMSGYNF